MKQYIISEKTVSTAMRFILNFDKENNDNRRFINAQSLTRCPEIPKDYDPEYLVKKLVSLGYIAYSRPDGFPCKKITLTDQGRCYFETRRAMRKQLLIRSVLLPIAVAFATTVLTIDIWPSVKQWLISLLQQMI